MIICKDRKIGIFLVPKTGTISLCSTFSKLNLFYCKHSHTKWPQAWHNFSPTIDDFDQYQFFAFYREPLDRFASAIAYFKRTLYRELIPAFYGNKHPISCATTRPYETLPTEIKMLIEQITVTQILDHKGLNMMKTSMLQHQQLWFDYPINIKYLDFKNYIQEVKFLLSIFNVNGNEIPHLNRSYVPYPNSDLTKDEVVRVKDIYRSDYDFFASKGITFSS